MRQIFKALREKRIKKIPTDHFIRRLGSSVIGEGMLHKGNIYLMDYAIHHMPDNGHVLEIGSFGGLSTNLLLHLMRKHGKEVKMFNCDPWIYQGYYDDQSEIAPDKIDGSDTIDRRDYMAYIKNGFVNSVRLLSADHLPHSFEMTSDEFFAVYGKGMVKKDLFEREIQLGGDISFAYIDGNHAYDYAKRDFENVDNHLLKGGFILFDDSMEGASFGSAALMPEIMRNPGYRLVEKNPNYLFEKLG